MGLLVSTNYTRDAVCRATEEVVSQIGEGTHGEQPGANAPKRTFCHWVVLLNPDWTCRCTDGNAHHSQRKTNRNSQSHTKKNSPGLRGVPNRRWAVVVDPRWLAPAWKHIRGCSFAKHQGEEDSDAMHGANDLAVERPAPTTCADRARLPGRRAAPTSG